MGNGQVNVREIAFKAIFNDNLQIRYKVPLYQREYAWGRREISQMMTDLWEAFSLNPHRKYYLGTLVVMPEKDGSSSQKAVIDGQQRLTTLSLLAGLMAVRLKTPVLSFETREETNSFLKAYCMGDDYDSYFDERSSGSVPRTFLEAIELLRDFRPALGANDERGLDEHELSLRTGLLKETIEGVSFASFIQDKVTLFEVILPPEPDADAMDYFEVMNNRGAQLEFHELLKAELMAKLHELCNSETAPDGIRGRYEVLSHWFNLLWTACSKMNGHLVDHLHACYKLQCNPEMSWLDLVTETESGDLDGRDVQHERQSVITDFSNFLMHVLRLYVVHKVNVPLDERKIEETFNKVKERLGIDPVKFLQTLLRARLDFDRFVVKAKIENDVVVEWRLKEVVKSSGKFYAKCTFGRSEEAADDEILQKKLMYLEAALQVSNAVQRYKEWVYAILSASAEERGNGNRLLRLLEDFAAARIRDAEEYWRAQGRDFFRLGLQTPRLLLNLIDYLMWKSSEEHRDGKFDFAVPRSFVFNYNNSIEHHHSQHDDTSKPWKAKVAGVDLKDDIGNLYLTSTSENSSMGKHSTKEKVSMFSNSGRGGPNGFPLTPKRHWMYANTGEDWTQDTMKQLSDYVISLVTDFVKKTANAEGLIRGTDK